MILRSTVDDLLMKALHRAFEPIIADPDQLSNAGRSELVFRVERAFNTGMLRKRTAFFILSRVHTPTLGNFRIRGKLKNELDARPVTNLSRSWIQPAADFLCDKLEPIQSSQRLADFLATGYRCITDDRVLGPVNAIKPHEIIAQESLLKVVPKHIRQKYLGNIELQEF